LTLHIDAPRNPAPAAAEFARYVARASAIANRSYEDMGLAALENGTFFCRRLAEQQAKGE
jgi:hypothetical protein